MLPGLVRAGVISGWAASIVALCQGRCWPATSHHFVPTCNFPDYHTPHLVGVGKLTQNKVVR